MVSLVSSSSAPQRPGGGCEHYLGSGLSLWTTGGQGAPGGWAGCLTQPLNPEQNCVRGFGGPPFVPPPFGP